MTELPASGTYNLMGTADGLYDKLTSGKLYGGYYKNIVPFFEDFSYSNDAGVYDGANIVWPFDGGERADAANFVPQNEATYYVKEVPAKYLRSGGHVQYAANTGAITTFYHLTALDDGNYENARIKLDSGYVQPSFTHQLSFKKNGVVTNVVTPASEFGVIGVVDSDVAYIAYYKDTSVVLTLGTHTVLPSLITYDGYEVSGKYLRTYTVTNPNINDENGMTSVETVVGPTITKVAPP